MDISKTYGLSLAPRILFGVGTVQQTGSEASRVGITRALVVTDGGLVQTDIPGKVTKALDEAGVKWTLFGEVEPNPSIGTVHKGLDAYTRQQCDGIVAVGGGSPIDAAKAIGILATNGGEIREYFGADRIKKPLPPLVAIPTTCGTGSEVTQFTVITDTEAHFKMGIGSPLNIPKVAIVDPALLAKLPGRMVAATGMDALCHCIESYTSQAAQFLSDAFALRAIELIGRHLRPAAANGNMIDLTGMAMASTLAGLAFNNTRTTLVHAMSHAVTAYAQVPHGIANAILVRYVMEFNLIGNPAKHADIGVALGEDTDGLLPMEAGHVAVDAVRELADDVGIPQTLREVGVTEAMVEPMTDSALKSVMGVALNPRRPSREDVVALYRSAISGC
jgi:alcohol dehydrogenase class IV